MLAGLQRPAGLVKVNLVGGGDVDRVDLLIVEQVLASCKFEGITPQFTPENVDDALANLFVAKADDTMFGVKRS